MPMFAPCFLLLLSVATIAVITLCIVGRRDPARALCSACRALLAPALLVPAASTAPSPCPSCGASLESPRAIRPARRLASKGTWIALAVVLVLWPLLIALVMFATTMRGMPPLGSAPVALALDALVARVVQETGGNATMQVEFSRRLNAGDVDLDVARTTLLAELPAVAAAPSGTTQPGGLVVATPLLERDPGDTALMDALLDAYQPAPTLQVARRDPKDLHVVVEACRRGVGAPQALQTVLVLRRIVADGREIPFAPFQKSAAPRSPEMIILSNHAAPSRTVRLDASALGDAAEIELQFDAMLYDAFDAQRMAGMAWSGAPLVDWPKPMRSREHRVPLRVKMDAAPDGAPPAASP